MKRKVTVTLLISMLIFASLMPTAFAASDCNSPTAGNINDLLQQFCSESGTIDYSKLPASADQLLSNYLGDQSILQQLQDCQQNGGTNSGDIQSILNQVNDTVASANVYSNSCPVQPSAAPAAPAITTAPAPTAAPAPEAPKAPEQSKAPIATAAPVQTPAPTPVQTPAPTATKAPEAPSGNNNANYASNLEKEMVAMVNQERQAAGLPALVIDQGLTANARAHSADMAKSNYFSHTSPTYGSFSQRLKSSGISYLSGGENIARYGDVAKAHVGLMNSEGHRANIMNSGFTHIGIGIVWDDDMNAYCITQWFAKLR